VNEIDSNSDDEDLFKSLNIKKKSKEKDISTKSDKTSTEVLGTKILNLEKKNVNIPQETSINTNQIYKQDFKKILKILEELKDRNKIFENRLSEINKKYGKARK